jgi:hypothetical protein
VTAFTSAKVSHERAFSPFSVYLLPMCQIVRRDFEIRRLPSLWCWPNIRGESINNRFDISELLVWRVLWHYTKVSVTGLLSILALSQKELITNGMISGNYSDTKSKFVTTGIISGKHFLVQNQKVCNHFLFYNLIKYYLVGV